MQSLKSKGKHAVTAQNKGSYAIVPCKLIFFITCRFMAQYLLLFAYLMGFVIIFFSFYMKNMNMNQTTTFLRWELKIVSVWALNFISNIVYYVSWISCDVILHYIVTQGIENV